MRRKPISYATQEFVRVTVHWANEGEKTSCMYVCMHACMHACMHYYILTYVCVYMCMYVCM
jgi:hypothetical protein